MSNNGKREILVIVEGDRTDAGLMKHLFSVYKIDSRYNIVSYGTNIYALYNSMIQDKTPENFDILMHMRSREPDVLRKEVFNKKYSEILLIFDFEPHDVSFSDNKVKDMVEFFNESTEMGKLYINYPMVEAFYHMKSIPDYEYHTYYATLKELRGKKYKTRVNIENRDRDYSKFAVTKLECDTVIKQNIMKAHMIVYDEECDNIYQLPKSTDILEKQLSLLIKEQNVAVLCTCTFYIAEYNIKLLTREN